MKHFLIWGMTNELNISIRFAEVLKKLRKKEGLRQQTLGDLLQIDRSAIANYERGERMPSLDTLVAIAEQFSVSLDYLIKGKSMDYKSTVGKNMIAQELMAENIALMESQLKLMEEVKKKDEEIAVLKEYIEAQKKYYKLLEDHSNG